MFQLTDHRVGGSPWTAHGGQTRSVVSSTRHKQHIMLLHSLIDHLTDPPEIQITSHGH